MIKRPKVENKGRNRYLSKDRPTYLHLEDSFFKSSKLSSSSAESKCDMTKIFLWILKNDGTI